MNEQKRRRAWSLLIVLGTIVTAAALWTLPGE
jgi:hypothetical protein